MCYLYFVKQDFFPLYALPIAEMWFFTNSESLNTRQLPPSGKMHNWQPPSSTSIPHKETNCQATLQTPLNALYRKPTEFNVASPFKNKASVTESREWNTKNEWLYYKHIPKGSCVAPQQESLCRNVPSNFTSSSVKCKYRPQSWDVIRTSNGTRLDFPNCQQLLCPISGHTQEKLSIFQFCMLLNNVFYAK